MNHKRLLAIDPSLICSGWAFYTVSTGELLGVGNVRTLGTDCPLSKRLGVLQERVQSLYKTLDLDTNDVLICEDVTSVLDPSATSKLEQVRGIFETLARHFKVLVPGRVHPRSVQFEVLGLYGKQLNRKLVKESAVDVAIRLFSKHLAQIGFDPSSKNLKRNQDIVDALLIGSLGLTRIKQAMQVNIGIEEFFDKQEKQIGKYRPNSASLR